MSLPCASGLQNFKNCPKIFSFAVSAIDTIHCNPLETTCVWLTCKNSVALEFVIISESKQDIFSQKGKEIGARLRLQKLMPTSRFWPRPLVFLTYLKDQMHGAHGHVLFGNHANIPWWPQKKVILCRWWRFFNPVSKAIYPGSQKLWVFLVSAQAKDYPISLIHQSGLKDLRRDLRHQKKRTLSLACGKIWLTGAWAKLAGDSVGRSVGVKFG